MYTDLKPVSYHGVTGVPIPFQEIMAIGASVRHDAERTEDQINSVSAWLAENPSVGLAQQHVDKYTSDLRAKIADSDMSDPSTRLAMRRYVSDFKNNPFWGINRANYQAYLQSEQQAAMLKAQGKWNEADELKRLARFYGDEAAKIKLKDLGAATGEDYSEYWDPEKAWDGTTAVTQTYSAINREVLKYTGEQAAKGVTPLARTIQQKLGGFNILTNQKYISKTQIDDALSDGMEAIRNDPNVKQQFIEHLAKGDNLYNVDGKSGDMVVKGQDQLAQEYDQFLYDNLRSAMPDLKFNSEGISVVDEKNDYGLLGLQLEQAKLLMNERFQTEEMAMKRQFHKDDMSLRYAQLMMQKELQAAKLAASQSRGSQQGSPVGVVAGNPGGSYEEIISNHDKKVAAAEAIAGWRDAERGTANKIKINTDVQAKLAISAANKAANWAGRWNGAGISTTGTSDVWTINPGGPGGTTGKTSNAKMSMSVGSAIASLLPEVDPHNTSYSRKSASTDMVEFAKFIDSKVAASGGAEAFLKQDRANMVSTMTDWIGEWNKVPTMDSRISRIATESKVGDDWFKTAQTSFGSASGAARFAEAQYNNAVALSSQAVVKSYSLPQNVYHKELAEAFKRETTSTTPVTHIVIDGKGSGEKLTNYDLKGALRKYKFDEAVVADVIKGATWTGKVDAYGKPVMSFNGTSGEKALSIEFSIEPNNAVRENTLLLDLVAEGNTEFIKNKGFVAQDRGLDWDMFQTGNMVKDTTTD
jgi:hypothetical protein